MSAVSQNSSKTFLGHPHALFSLFHVELWERFSFYGMQAILLFYLYFETSKGGLGIDKATAGGIAAAYSGSIYMATLLGGWVADRLLGSERTLFYSGIIIMLGHIALAIIPGITGLVTGLILVALGSGGLKPCASGMVGTLYEQDDTSHLRDAGFSLFYLAINIGGFFGPLISGWLQSNMGFHYGFGSAAIGMAAGLIIYSMGRKQLAHTKPVNPLTAQEKPKVIALSVVIIAAIISACVFNLLRFDNFKDVLFGVVITLTVIYFARLLINGREMGAKQNHIIAYIPLFIATCLFWSVWFQVYTAVSIYFEGVMNRTVGGFTIPEAWLGSAQSFWVITLAGSMTVLWTKLGEKQPKTPLKFALSLIIVGLSYAVFLPFTMNNMVMPLAFIMVVVFLLTVAELLISPISLSLATKIAPSQFKTQMVALSFLALSIGITGGGKIFSHYYDEQNLSTFFQLMTMMGVISGIILLLFVPILNKLLKGID